MSQPEIQRQARQQRGDIDALYELVDRRFDEISGQLSESYGNAAINSRSLPDGTSVACWK